MNGADYLRAVRLSVNRVKQLNLCGCGLAALETVLRYYGADVAQLDFLKADSRLRRKTERENRRGLSETTIGLLAVKRGFKVSIYGAKPRAAKTFIKLGGRIIRTRTGVQLMRNLLERGIPPIVRIPNVAEAYRGRAERIPHYVVVRGINENGLLEVVDPWYETAISRDYWKQWRGSIIAVEAKKVT